MILVAALLPIGLLTEVTESSDFQQKKEKSDRVYEAYEIECARMEELLTTPRLLRKMHTTEVGVHATTASFSHVIFAGNASKNERSYTNTDVVFAWERETDEYVISRVPLDKIRFQLLPDTTAQPSVAFTWHTQRGGRYSDIYKDPNRYISKGRLVSATIWTHEEGWPSEITFPLN